MDGVNSQPSANPPQQIEEATPISLIAAVCQTAGEVGFTLQNALTVCAGIIIPVLSAVFGCPARFAWAIGILFLVGFFVYKLEYRTQFKRHSWIFGIASTVVIAVAAFVIWTWLPSSSAAPAGSTIDSAVGAIPKPATPSLVPVPGSNITTGNDSPAVSGTGNTFNYTAPKIEPKGMKPK